MSCKYEVSKHHNTAQSSGIQPVDVPGIAADAKSEIIEQHSRRNEDFCDPICISVDKVYDACRERNCIVDARVFFTECGQEVIENAINVKLKNAEVIWVYTDTEPLMYSSGYYSIDIKYFIDVTIEAFSGVSTPTEVHGLVTYDKRVMLYGSEGETKSFKSNIDPGEDMEHIWRHNNLPEVTVEVVDPIALSAKIVDDSCCCGDSAVPIPKNICCCYDQNLVTCDKVKKVLVSMGIFTIVRIERRVQIMINAIDFCIPEKTCVDSTPQDPCDLFNQVRFPIDEFFPPSRQTDIRTPGCTCGCGCNK